MQTLAKIYAEIRQVAGSNEAFDVEIYSPEIEGKTCILLNTGKGGTLGLDDADAVFSTQLAIELRHRGVSLVRIGMPVREDLSKPATMGHIEHRASRLEAVLRAPELSMWLQSYSICALSLGASAVVSSAVLKTFTPQLSRVILVGYFSYKPMLVCNPNVKITLVYGSHDFISILRSDGTMSSALSPEEYGPQVGKCFVTSPKNPAGVRIVTGLSHDLLDPAEHNYQRGAKIIADLCIIS